MAIYFIGDIQGCYHELQALLAKVSFCPDSDLLYVAGDLVARGPDSLSTLRLLHAMDNCVRVVLGNHDLHLLAVYAGIKRVKTQDHLTSLLAAPDAKILLEWLAQQPLIQKLPNEDVYMSHAGLPPQWSPDEAQAHAEFVHTRLASTKRNDWLSVMYGEQPNNWTDVSTEVEKFRYIVNALTRMRFCYRDGSLEFSCKESIASAPMDLKPWFEFGHITKNTSWLFGHWAALMGNCRPNNVYALDTGCVWGNYLTMIRWHDKKVFIEHAHKKQI
jgi:bis(5'-nucleosyl)-tetraphosphatase (symmetrical)